ncbi:MAG: tryptophan synthase subunit alpha [Clostridiales bacterium]|nr:tryptophan synthase subunit alpha [Clostridiales bacterium]MCF8023435.1 tryptophan synthase subunit alpha [Clostridiales bacterium]
MNNRLEKLSYIKNSGKKTLIPYIMAGDINLDTTVEIALTMARSGADAIEIGIPFSDPVADGPVIQKAAARALSSGIKIKDIMDSAARIRQESDIPLVIMTYYNPVFRYGTENFAAAAHDSGIDGIIIPDLPLEESGHLHDVLKEKNMAIIPLIAPNSGNRRITNICDNAQGFIYCISVTGTTGTRDKIKTNLQDFTSRVRKNTSLPVAVGFGISGPQNAAEISSCCDAVVIGSLLVDFIYQHRDNAQFLTKLGEKISEIKKALTPGGEHVACT